jgi:hypothetical protein
MMRYVLLFSYDSCVLFPFTDIVGFTILHVLDPNLYFVVILTNTSLLSLSGFWLAQVEFASKL